MIRTFIDEAWICGWFGADGKVIDVQQYDDEESANKHAKILDKKGFYPFVGKIVNKSEV